VLLRDRLILKAGRHFTLPSADGAARLAASPGPVAVTLRTVADARWPNEKYELTHMPSR
jgi:hypothetical protein